jgi:hypothetical protein
MYEKAKRRSALIMAISLLTAGCAPTYAPHIDSAAAIPASDSQPSVTECTSSEKKKIAALDPRPLLPDAEQAVCPIGSGLAACFTLDEDIVRQRRFKILHDDREYCRDAYDRAVKRVAGE